MIICGGKWKNTSGQSQREEFRRALIGTEGADPASEKGSKCNLRHQELHLCLALNEKTFTLPPRWYLDPDLALRDGSLYRIIQNQTKPTYEPEGHTGSTPHQHYRYLDEHRKQCGIRKSLNHIP